MTEPSGFDPLSVPESNPTSYPAPFAERARQRGAKNLFLGVWESNERAIALYEGTGFEKVGGYKFKVGDTLDDEFIMRLRLA